MLIPKASTHTLKMLESLDILPNLSSEKTAYTLVSSFSWMINFYLSLRKLNFTSKIKILEFPVNHQSDVLTMYISSLLIPKHVSWDTKLKLITVNSNIMGKLKKSFLYCPFLSHATANLLGVIAINREHYRC